MTEDAADTAVLVEQTTTVRKIIKVLSSSDSVLLMGRCSLAHYTIFASPTRNQSPESNQDSVSLAILSRPQSKGWRATS